VCGLSASISYIGQLCELSASISYIGQFYGLSALGYLGVLESGFGLVPWWACLELGVISKLGCNFLG
jgi:hypothetical protein